MDSVEAFAIDRTHNFLHSLTINLKKTPICTTLAFLSFEVHLILLGSSKYSIDITPVHVIVIGSSVIPGRNYVTDVVIHDTAL